LEGYFWSKFDHFFSIKRAAYLSQFPHSNIPHIPTLKASNMDDPNRFLFPMDTFGVETPCSPYLNNDYHTLSENSSSNSTGTSSTLGPKRRKKTSVIWEHYVEEEFVDGDGTTKLRAKCLHRGCTSRFSLQKGGGNGHMMRHMKTHAKKDEQSAAIQSRIKFNPDGSKGIFVYDQERQKEALACLIASNDLPLGFGESPTFAKYIRTSHTSDFKRCLDKLQVGI
jgi:hypothetical protein